MIERHGEKPQIEMREKFAAALFPGHPNGKICTLPGVCASQNSDCTLIPSETHLLVKFNTLGGVVCLLLEVGQLHFLQTLSRCLRESTVFDSPSSCHGDILRFWISWKDFKYYLGCVATWHCLSRACFFMLFRLGATHHCVEVLSTVVANLQNTHIASYWHVSTHQAERSSFSNFASCMTHPNL